jgi:hypothetical protein
MPKLTVLTGRRFGRLSVAEIVGKTPNRKYQYRCICDCGAETVVVAEKLNSGHTKSCGCLIGEVWRGTSGPNFRHGYSHSPTYESWIRMVRRCTLERDKDYPNYGARGVTVCERWRTDFANFLSDMGERPAGKSIDRYPISNGNYEPSNCRWATPFEQSQNTTRTKLTAESVLEIRRRRAAGERAQSIADSIGVTTATVYRVVSGATWSNIQ